MLQSSQHRSTRPLLTEGERGNSFGSLSSNSTTQHDDNSEEESLVEALPTASLASQTHCSSSISTDGQDYVSKRQLLSVLTIFVCGVGCGITGGVSYVKYVQDRYGFGKDPTMEDAYLPFGPQTHSQTSELLAAQNIARASEPNQERPQKKTKQILLNRENAGATTIKHGLTTLFGIDYNSVVGLAETDDSETNKAITPTVQVSSSWYNLASNPQISLANSESEMIQSVAQKVHQNIPDLDERSPLVSWGGPSNAVAADTHFWSHKKDSNPSFLAGLDGGHLLYGYLFIMKWNPNPHFPFRLCGEDGCPPERAISHTLEWREKYKPWLAPPSLLKENVNGFSYHRGLSPAAKESEKHSIVWLRLGHRVKDDLSFFRGILHAADRAIADALIQSKGETGKFNVMIDCAGFSLSGTPSMQALKQGVTMLQDHYPNRLGMIFLANLSRPGEMFLNVVLRLITKEVRDKVKILPNSDKAKTWAILRTVVDEEYIPDWLGGTDKFRFNVEEYYPEHLRCTEEDAREFLTTMPYHAK